MINNHHKHTWYGFKTYKPFPLVIFASSMINHSCVFWFDWVEIMFCRYECGYGLEDHCKDPNHMRSFGPLFHQEVLNMAKCVGNHFLPLDSHLGKGRSCSWCMWPKVHITYVSICSTHVSQVKGVYMDPLGLGYTMKQIYDKHKKIGGIGQMWLSRWTRMISSDSKILFTWIESTRGALGAYKKTQHFSFSHGFMFILMMFFYF
jgi:hypothetical protein